MRTTILQLTCDCCGKIEKTDIPIVARIYEEVVNGGRIARCAIQQGITTKVPDWIKLDQQGSRLLFDWGLRSIDEICNECYQAQECLRQELLANLPELKKHAKEQIKKDRYSYIINLSQDFWNHLYNLKNQEIPVIAAAFHKIMIQPSKC